jgi:hypothetical protein
MSQAITMFRAHISRMVAASLIVASVAIIAELAKAVIPTHVAEGVTYTLDPATGTTAATDY